MRKAFYGLIAASILSSIAVAGPSFTVELNSASSVTVSRNLYGINVARWDESIFPESGNKQLLTANRPVMQRLVDMHPAFLKYPGGGDANTFVWNNKDNSPKDMDPWEFMGLCRACNAPGFITVNFSQPPALAAAWVTEMKKYAENVGEPVPWWEVGDEIWGRWAKGHTTGDKYATGFNEFAKVMKKADPSIKMVADLAISAPDTSWTREAMARIESCDMYTCTWFAQTSGKEDDRQLLDSVSKYYELYGRLKTFVDDQRTSRGLPPAEFCLVGLNSVDFHPGPQSVEMVNAVFMAKMYAELASSGINMAAWWAFQNPWPVRGGDYGLVASDAAATPYFTYHVFKMLSSRFWGTFIGKGSTDGVEWCAVKSDNGDAQFLLTNSNTSSVQNLEFHLTGAHLSIANSDVVTSASVGNNGPGKLSATIIRGNSTSEQILQVPELPGYGVALVSLSASPATSN